MKKLTIIFLFCVIGWTGTARPGWGASDDPAQAEDKARELHKLAASDVIYSQEEIKALYYQNIQIIDLLTQIRDLLQSRLRPEKE